MDRETTEEYVARKAEEYKAQARKERLEKLKAQKAVSDDADREMGLPEDMDFGYK